MNKHTVLITGAFTEIGRATAIAFAKTGANIVVSGQNEEKGESMVKELSSFKIDADYIFADVCQEEDVRNLVDFTKFRFGSLDTAINIAETKGKKSRLIIDQMSENFNESLEMSVRGTFFSLKHEMRVMSEQKSGVIVNFLSPISQRGEIDGEIFTAGRRAVEELTKSASLEAAKENVRVNAVASETGSPEEIAKMIVYLASSKAYLITGQIIGIEDGKIVL